MRILLAVALCGISSGPVGALDLDFNGVVASTCSLSLGVSGTLALSASGVVIGSDVGIAVPATVAILSIGANTVNVAAPVRVSADPAGYQAASEIIEVAYSGVDGLSLVSQAYTASPTSFAVGNIPLSVLSVHNRISNSAGFAAGTYTTRTVITCN